MTVARQKQWLMPTLAILALIAGLGAYILTQGSAQPYLKPLFNPTSAPNYSRWNTVVFPTPIPVSDMPFLNEDNEATSKNQLNGAWSLLFFGYTYCPDVCPTTLATMQSAWQQLLPEQQQNLNVVMVSVDPERDTPQQIKQYMDYFNPAFTALTGNPASLKSIATQLNAIYAKVPRRNDAGEVDETIGYLMDHSANIVILNPAGEYAGFIKPPFTPANMKQVMVALQG